MNQDRHAGNRAEDFEDLFENTHCGHLILDPQGYIARCNHRFASWVGASAAELAGIPFSSLLSKAGQIYHETHWAPLLRMQGFIDEISLDLQAKDGGRIKVLVNALERRDSEGKLLFIRLTAFLATERQIYEQNLRLSRALAEQNLSSEQEAARLREQFIAILGHDLRNPLGAITMGTALLSEAQLPPEAAKLVEVMDGSARRMAELIDKLLDFARFRLGGGLALKKKTALIGPLLHQIAGELTMAHPGREVQVEAGTPIELDCDPDRISQLISNLIANALTHGAQDQPVRIDLVSKPDVLELSVANKGKPIPPELLNGLFQPFVRAQAGPNQQGLGLGLYIALEIAKAHGGNLFATSTAEETRFTFEMPIHPATGPFRG